MDNKNKQTLLKIAPVIESNEVDGNTKMAITTWSTDSVEVCLGMLREVKVYHHIHCLYIYTSCEQIYIAENKRYLDVCFQIIKEKI